VKAILPSLLLAVATALTASAQTATFTSQTTNFDPAGGTVVFDVQFDRGGQILSSIGFEIDQPTGWSYVITGAEFRPASFPQFTPETTPSADETTPTLGFAYQSNLASFTETFGFTAEIRYPSGLTEDQVFNGRFLFSVEGGGGQQTVNMDAITISPPPTAPSFTQQPQSQSVNEGEPVSLAVQVEGSPTPTVQWNLNGSPISGATETLYSLTGVTGADAGDYTVTASNGVGDPITSDVATLSINTIPVINSEPESQSVNQGNSTTLSVGATGTMPFSYQWRKGGVNIDGATSETLGISNAQPSDAGSYDVVVSNVAGSVTSAAAVITVVEAPVIGTPPQGSTVSEGTEVTFTVSATGTEPVSYQWFKDGEAISGATDNSYTIDSAVVGDAGSYTVEVSNAAGTVTSDAGDLVVQFKPVINTQPADQTTGANGSVIFTVEAEGNPNELTYQWYEAPAEGGSPTQVGSMASLELTNLQLTDNGKTYYVDVSNSIGSTTSETATLTVNQGPGFTQQPDSATVTEGANVNLTVAVTGNPTPTVQWQFSAEPLESGDSDVAAITSPGEDRVYTDLAGQTGVTLALTSINRNQRGYYRAVASNSVASGVESSPAFVDVQFRPEITEDLADQSAGVGGTATFTLDGVANPDPTFQWYLNGSPISGATDAEYTTATLALENNGNTYYAIIDNGIGDPVQTRTATLTVNEQGQVTSAPESATVLEGDPVSFTIEFSGNPTPTIQWRLNGQPIAGANSATYSIAMANRNQAGEYTAVVSNEFGSDTSEVATLAVNFAPEITRDLPAQTTANVGATITLNVDGEASPEPRFQWFEKRPDTPSDGGETPAITSPGMEDEDGFYPIKEGSDGDLVLENLTLEDSGTMFYLEAENGIGETVRSATTTLLVVAPPSFTTQPAGATIDEGANYTMTVAAGGTPAPSIQWFFNGNAIAGATGGSYTITSAVATDGGTYTAVASNAGNQITSNEAVVVVNTIPTIITQPTGASLFVGEGFSTSVSATGFQPITYQWQQDGVDVAGATSATFSIDSVGVDDAGVYTAVVTNQVGTVTSAGAALEVSLVLKAPRILVPPRDTKVATGETFTLFVEVDANPVPSFQWSVGGVDIPGATSATFAVADASDANSGTYRVRVTNTQGEVTSGPARVTVTDSNEAPIITSQPRNRTAALETSVSFSVAATGVPAPTYQWSLNGVAIEGATSATYTIPSVAAANGGAYSATVSNTEGSVVSRNAILAVITRSFEGEYFGTFGDGSFAVAINADNTGTFVGFDETNGLRIVGDVTVDDNGEFTFTVTSITPQASAASSDDIILSRLVIGGANTPSVASNEVTISGIISESGGVSGSVEGVDGVNLEGEIQEGSETEGISGFYQASADGVDAVTYTIIAPNGKVLVLTETPDGADAGEGTASSNGSVNVTTVANNTVTATVVADAETIQTEVTDSSGGKTSFSGGSDEVIASQRLVNISSRAAAGTGEAQAIAGLVITGEDSKPVLIRAVGPGLSEFGVTGVLAAPKLDLYSGQTIIASNTNWTTSADAADITEAGATAGAFALQSTDADSAIVETLAPGSYTAQVSGADGASGVVLVEVYDLSAPALGQKLFNISTRADVGSGNETVVAGFVVSGSVPKRVLLRGVGPTLGDYGVNNALADPQITLFRDATVVASNDNWNNSVSVVNASTATGAFQLTADSNDAAMVISLEPGVYTLHLRGGGGTSGIGLIEVYEIP
jgi:large repetitive protein